jgi:hypothetical protein
MATSNTRSRDEQHADPNDVEMYLAIFRGLKSLWRSICVGYLYFFACIVFDVPLGRAFLIFATVALMHRMALGGRRLAQIGIITFLVAALFWVNIFPLKRWAELANIQIEAMLAK